MTTPLAILFDLDDTHCSSLLEIVVVVKPQPSVHKGWGFGDFE
jgi:hypothetical protein